MLILSFQNVFSQVYNSGYETLFFERCAGAKNEAMGKILSVGNSSYFTLFANPAINTENKEISAYYSYSNPYYSQDKFGFNFLGITTNLGNIGAFGVALLHNNWGEYTYSTIENPHGQKYFAFENLYTASYARSIGKICDFGVEGNLYVDNRYLNKSFQNSFFTIGLSKAFLLKEGSTSKDILHTGLQIVNLFGQGVKYDYSNPYWTSAPVKTFPFPSILRIGIENELILLKNESCFDQHYITIRTSLEYEDLLNSKTRSSFKFGSEITTLDLISLRFGYFNTQLDYWFNIKKKLDAFTFGAGLNIDLREYTENWPFALLIDYVNMKQTVIENSNYSGNYNTIQARIRYFWN